MINDIDIIEKPEGCILDCNKGEKLIVEMNNHICLGEYELSRSFFKQIISVVPKYLEYFYKIIFQRGIPDKWLLTNQIRTSANYIWLLYQEYKNELIKIDNCPVIYFEQNLLKSNEFDLLITSAFYNSFETLEINDFKISIEFLEELRNLYNTFLAVKTRTTTFIPKLRILSPDKIANGLYLSIPEKFYSEKASEIKMKITFFTHFKNLILTQPILSNFIVEQLIDNCINNMIECDDFQQNILIIYVDLIMLFVHYKDYQLVYDYLKYLPYNKTLKECKSYIVLLLSVIVILTNINNLNIVEIMDFSKYVVKNLNVETINSNKNFFNHYLFRKESEVPLLYFRKEFKPTKDHEKWILKVKVYESLLGNKHNKELLDILHDIEDKYIMYQKEKNEIPVFLEKFSKNLQKKYIFDGLSYEELMNLVIAYSKFLEEDLVYLWKKATNNIFWNEYINFLRVYNEHCLGYVLKESIRYVKGRKFDIAVIFLHPLNNLKLMLILFVWDYFENDINSRKEILEIFWESYLQYRENQHSYTLVPYFEDIIINLDYLINYSMWIHKKLKIYQIDIDSNKIYEKLSNYSIPYVLIDHLTNFEVKEMISYFKIRFPSSNKKLQKTHFHSSMIIFSFYLYRIILKKIEDYYNNSHENSESQLFTDTEQKEMTLLLNKIILVPYRLNIMGDIFNLILIKQKDFENKDNSEPQQFLFNKKVFIELLSFLKEIMKPLENFDFDNLNLIFDKMYLDEDTYMMIKDVIDKEIFLEDLKEIDTDYLLALKKEKNINYKDFLIKKSRNLKNNVDEIIFRFNIVDNPWLEIIFENSENKNFLSRILQNNKHYFQIAKKFHMWDIAKEIIRFFKLPSDYENKIDLFKYFTELKTTLKNDKDFEFDKNSIINSNYLKELLIKNLKKRPLDKEEEEKFINFEYFKLLFDLSLTEDISPYKSTQLLQLAEHYLGISNENLKLIFTDIIEKYKMLIDPKLNISKDQKLECLSKLVVSTKNLETVPFTYNVSSIKTQIEKLSSQKEKLLSLIEIVKNNNQQRLTHTELEIFFTDAYKTLVEYEDININQDNLIEDSEKYKTHKTPNYLKIFLSYLIEIGNIYYNAQNSFSKSSSNYLKMLTKFPKEIIAKLFLKYNSEKNALNVAKRTKTDIISVILEYTKYYKKSIINFSEFNNFFQEFIEKESTNLQIDTISDKEGWIGSSKTYPLSMKILEFIYQLSDSKEITTNYIHYVPLFVSLYRVDFENLNDDDQFKFWNLLIDKYSELPILKNYIKLIFSKFYFIKTFYQKNLRFKDLYKKLFHKENTNTKQKESLCNTYKKIDEYITNNKSTILPKTFNYMPITNEYRAKLEFSLKNYVKGKLNQEPQNYDVFENTKIRNDLPKKDLGIKFQDITNTSYQKNINFYENLCRGLLVQKQYDLALEIADNHLYDSKINIIQEVIGEIAKNTNDEEKLFKLLLRMKNKKLVFDYIKRYLYNWKPETSLTMLKLLKEEKDLNQTEISNLIKKLKVFSVILKRHNLTKFNNINSLEKICTENIMEILQILMDLNSHDLCYKLLSVYGKFDLYKNEVKFSEIKLLLSSNEVQNKITALEKLNEVDVKIQFCLSLIKEINNYQNKLLIINYLLQNYKYELNEKISQNLENQKIAIKVFFQIPKNLQEKLNHLIFQPNIIIETLLINMKFEIIKNIFYYFPNLQDDKLITIYAEKTMSFDKKKIKINPNTFINSSDNNDEDLVILTANSNLDNEISLKHYFKSAPDFELFIRFMNLCTNIQIIGTTCFKVSNNCSKYLLEKNPPQPKILFINFIIKVLKYLETRIQQNLESQDSKSKHDIDKIRQKLSLYKKLTDLFKEFIYQGIDNLVDLELQKFFDDNSYRIFVRDKLIENDYLNLAMKYCNELGIDSSRVDLELGLFLLKNRNFDASRKRFEKILKPNYIRQIETENNLKDYHNNVVYQIIKILHGSFNLRIDEIDKIHKYLSFRLICRLVPNEEKTLNLLKTYKELMIKKQKNPKNSFSSINISSGIILKNYIDVILLDEYLQREKLVIVNETLHYVKTYGTVVQLFNFYIDNNMLDEAIDYIITNKTPIHIFNQEVVRKCYEKNIISYLCAVLITKHKSNEYVQKLIKEVVIFLDNQKAHKELINFYESMEEYLKAGLESLTMANQSKNGVDKLYYFNLSCGNIKKYLFNNSNQTITVTDSVDQINKKVDRESLIKLQKTIEYQIEILNIIPNTELSLLKDDEEEKYKIVQEIIILNDSLALKIIKEYEMNNLVEIFMRSTLTFLQSNQKGNFEKLLDVITKWEKENILKGFSVDVTDFRNNIILQAIGFVSDDKEYIKENLIPRYTNDYLRMEGYIYLDELENALILANQMKDNVAIQTIKKKALENKNSKVLDQIESGN